METDLRQAGGETITVTCRDWQGVRRASIEHVLLETMVGEIIDEARCAMELPPDTSYQAVLESEQLNHMASLQEIGIEGDVEFEIVPEVYAG